MAKVHSTLREKIIDAAAIAGLKKTDMQVSAIGDGKLLGRLFDFFKTLLPVLLPIFLSDEDGELGDNIRASATECGLTGASAMGVTDQLEKWLKFFLTILPFLKPIFDEIGQ